MAKQQKADRGWIPPRTAWHMIALLSAGIAIFTFIQIYPIDGIWTASLWGLGAAAGLWIVFLISLAFNRLVRHRS